MAVEGVRRVDANHEASEPDITVAGPANVVAEAPDMGEQGVIQAGIVHRDWHSTRAIPANRLFPCEGRIFPDHADGVTGGKQ